jgi:hypothetical protein
MLMTQMEDSWVWLDEWSRELYEVVESVQYRSPYVKSLTRRVIAAMQDYEAERVLATWKSPVEIARLGL